MVGTGGQAAPRTVDGRAADLDVSVVLPARDAARELPAMLRSLAAQRYDGRWEVVVVDNGSTDGTAAVAMSFAESLPHLRVLDASGPARKSAALNMVLPQLRGRSLLFVDADDTVAAGYVEAMATALQQHVLVGARLDVDELNPPEVRARRAPMQVDGLGVLMRYAPVVIGAGMGVRADALHRVGGFDADLERLSDMDLSWRLQQQGATAAFVPRAVVHYRYRGGVAATFWQEVHYGEGEVTLYRRHRALVPRRRARTTVMAWVRLLVGVREAASPAGRYRLATMAGGALGRLRGSVRQRTLYL